MQREHVSAVWVQMFTRGAAGTDDGTAGAAAGADASATSEASWASSAGGGAAGGGGTSVALFAPPLSPSPAGDGGTATFFLAALQGTHFLLEPGLESCFLHRPRKTCTVYIINNPYMIRTSAESRRQCHGQSLQRALAVCSACSGAGAGAGAGGERSTPFNVRKRVGSRGKRIRRRRKKDYIDLH